MHQIVRWTCVVAALVYATPADAVTATRIKYVAIETLQGAVEVDLSTSVSTAIQLLAPHHDWRLGNGRDYRVEGSPHDPKALFVQPKVASPTFTVLRILSGTRWFTLELRMADEVSPISDLIFVPTEDDIPDYADSDGTVIVSSPLGYLATVADETEATPPVQMRWSDHGHHLTASLGTMRWTSEHVTFRFELKNHGDYPYPISKLTITDSQGNVHKAVMFPRALISGDYLLAPGQTLVGAVRVSEAAALRSGLQMNLASSPAVPAALFQWEGSRRWPKRGPLQKWLAVSVQAAGGAAKLDDGIGLARGAWTTSQCLGARVLYGPKKHISIEGNLDACRASAVTFEDANWDTDTGDLETDATAGRIMVGGLLHTAGERWVPYLRAALGVQVSRHSMAMGTRSETDTRLATVLGFGGGINLRIGKRLMAGASIAVTNGLAGDEVARTFEAGINIGASWDFARKNEF